MGQRWDSLQSIFDPVGLGRDLKRALVMCVIPVSIATFVGITVLCRSGHSGAVGLLIVGEFVGALALAAFGRWGGRPSSPSVRQINRRAAVILPLAGLALAMLLATIAVKPILLGLLGVVALLLGVPAAGALAVSELLYRRRMARMSTTVGHN